MKRALLPFASLLFVFSISVNASSGAQREIGPLHSRAIVKISEKEKHPTVILIPGSGANGPEEMVPASITLDEKDHSLFGQLTDALVKAGVNTIALGKPGVEFFSGWDREKWFYDKAMYQSLRWSDLLENVKAAVDFAIAQPGVDPSKIYLLGHSEGTQISVDYAALDPRVKGIILLGYFGASPANILDWQLFHRDIEFFIATDVDDNKDGFVSREEAAAWPEFRWQWADDQQLVSYDEIETVLRKNETLKGVFAKLENSPLYADGIFRRDNINAKAAALKQDIYVFNGELDMQTPAREALAIGSACRAAGKINCEVSIIPGVGHGFSAPKPPKAQPVLDLTVGPINSEFQSNLTQFARDKLINTAN